MYSGVNIQLVAPDQRALMKICIWSLGAALLLKRGWVKCKKTQNVTVHWYVRYI